MTEFFNLISNILGTALDFIVNLIKTVAMVMVAIPKALLFVTTAIGFLPPFVLAVVAVSIAVAIAHTLLNGGKQ